MLALGCATQGISTRQYTENVPVQIKNEIVVSKPYTQVWDIMVKEISKSFYVINNIDKESRIINLSFSTNSPTEYVDCRANVHLDVQYKSSRTARRWYGRKSNLFL